MKYYAESALRDPHPDTILNRSNAWCHMLKRIRKRDKRLEQDKSADMGRLLKYYKSAIAADNVLHTLSELKKIRH